MCDFHLSTVEVALVYDGAGLLVMRMCRCELLLQSLQVAGSELLLHVAVPQFVELLVILVLESLPRQSKQPEILRLLPRQSLLLLSKLLRLFHFFVFVFYFGENRQILNSVVLLLARVHQALEEVRDFYKILNV